MEYLIRRGMPQRTAHGLVGRLVRKALDAACGWPICRWRSFRRPMPELDESVYDVLGVEQAVAAMISYGSTGPEQVKATGASVGKKLLE